MLKKVRDLTLEEKVRFNIVSFKVNLCVLIR